MKQNVLAILFTSLLLGGCADDGATGRNGVDGQNGSNGTNGQSGTNGTNGQSTLVKQLNLSLGDQHCLLGGLQIDSGLDQNSNNTLDSSEIKQTSQLCRPHSFASVGVALPYQILRNDLINGARPNTTMEIRNGGFGSDMVAHPTQPMQFYAVTDRGPNADYVGELGAGKKFPVEDYVPRIGLFEIQPSGGIRLLKTILLQRPDGTPINGLPNPSGLGATNEIPYRANGEVLRVNPDLPYDPVTNPVKLDQYGLDSEGLVAMKDGTFWVSDEYGPHIVHYDATGKEIGRINPFGSDSRTQINLPAEFAKRRANRGMEGLTITPDEKTLVGIMQSTMSLPTGSVNKQTITRIVTIELTTGKIGQYLYRQEIAENSNSAIVALDNHSFLVLERDGKFYKDDANAMKHVYKIDLRQGTNLEAVTETATLKQDPLLGLTVSGKTLEQVTLDSGWEGLAALNIRPVSKTLVVDMVAQVNYPHDKMEGLWLMSNHRLGVINDDDFATWTKNNLIEQKYLDQAQTIIDSNTLYVIDDLDLNPLP